MALIRDIDPATLEAFARGAFHPVVLVLIDWPGDPVRVHSGVGTLTWAGEDWRGVGPLDGVIRLPAEGQGPASVEGEARLGGFDAQADAILSQATEARGAACEVWFGAVTERCGTVLAGEPFRAFVGSVGAVGDEESWSGDDAMRAVMVGLEGGPSQRSRASAYHSDADQRRLDPTDTAGRWCFAARANAQAQLPKW